MDQRHALVIGNSVYENSVKFPSIEYAYHDASKVISLLTDSSTSIFSKETSLCRLNLSRYEIDKVLEDFFSKVHWTDTVLFYFAGHAEVIGGKRLFLIMKDSQPEKLARSAFNIEALLPYFEEKKISRYIVVLDCCRAGIALNSPGVRYRGLINDLEIRSISGQGQVFAASAREYQVARELENLQHGLFTYYLISGIETGDATAPSKEFINILELVSYIQTQMSKKHPEYVQEPVVSGSDLVGELIVARNPKYEKEEAHLREFIDLHKKTLGLDDLSNAERVKQAQIKKLRGYLDELLKIGKEITSLKHLVLMYGEALGLDETTIAAYFHNYSASLMFNEPVGKLEVLHKLNGKGSAFLFSTGYGHPAYEMVDLESSLFSFHIREALLGRGANPDGDVTLASAFEYLQQHMGEYQGHVQRPILSANLSADPVLTSRRVDWQSFPKKRIAILVGINHYASPNLSSALFAESDILKIIKIIEPLGGFDCRVVTGESATLYNVKEIILSALSELNDGDLILFYFAGHGFSTEADGYAMLYDTELKESRTSLAVTELSRYLKQTGAVTTLVILDACMNPMYTSELLATEEID